MSKPVLNDQQKKKLTDLIVNEPHTQTAQAIMAKFILDMSEANK